MNMSSNLFEAFLKCPTKCWLRAAGEPGSGNDYADWVKSQTESYRVTEIERLLSEIPRDESAVAPVPANLKTDKWRLAVDVAAQASTPAGSGSVSLPGQTPGGTPGQPADETPALPARPEQGLLETRLHAIERIPSAGRGRPAQFVPIRFIYRNKVTKHDRLLLAFDAFVLSQMLGREASFGKIIHGDDHASLKAKVASLTGEVRKRIEKMTALLANPTPPDLVLNRHCAECEFRDRCRQKAVETDDLSLLAGMSAKERQKFRSKGIFTVNQLSFTFRPRKTPKRAKHPSNPRHYALQAQAIREKMVYIHGKPKIPTSERCLYFDVEGVPWRESYYLIGVLAVEAENIEYRSFWTNDDDQTVMIAEFCQFVRDYKEAPLFHYGHYDIEALREMGRLASGQVRNVLAKILPAAFNVLPVVHSHIYFPIHSARLRHIASFLGSEFTSGIRSGIESIMFREKWIRSGDEQIKNQLLAYNEDDCEALRKICDFIRQSVSLAEGRSPVPGRQENVALSESLRKAGEGNRPAFKRAEFALPEFEKINHCAYFDYQREKIYARRKRKIASPYRRPAHTIRHPSQDTEVVLKCRTCPRCGSKWLSLRKPIRRRLIDLKFYKTGIGVKRWQPSYLIQQYRCRSCKARVISPKIVNAERRGIYGHNLMCWCVYHNIVCKQSLLQVERSLDDIFGLKLPYKNIYRFRSSLANLYRPLQDEILASILHESVVNIDETPVNLRKTTGYVWVLATGNRVYYIYKESREGDFLKSLLAQFSGVLVADFFTAYDSIECLHQKCLVHLMRDINDDLRRYPFDGELRHIAQAFGSLLSDIVSTIDRWGLKAHHLHKHIKDAVGMLRHIHRRSFTSEHAMKYQKRFDKYAGSLFRFLHHDNIPWNNNNAEHAVHYFAKVRRFTDGTFTSSSIGELLTLVTVLQTCEYNGVNPLQFLLSGETSLTSMVKKCVARRHS